MRFEIVYGGSVVDGELRYLADDYSFAFAATDEQAECTSLQLDSLQLSIDETGRVLYPWGYCPLVRVAATGAAPPPFRAGELFSRNDCDLVPGVTVRVGGRDDWPVSRNSKTDWICLGEPEPKCVSTAVEFASSSVAVVADGRLVALWLKPATRQHIA